MLIVNCSLLPIAIGIANCQNLVGNSSFENHILCPDPSTTVAYSQGWDSYANTPDYFHECATDANYLVPNNGWGSQNAATDSAYGGFWAYYSVAPDSREFIGRQLSVPLSIGQKYFVSLKLSFAESSNCAVSKLGVHFSTVPFSQANPATVNNSSHFYTNTIITDVVNWVDVSGSFVADSAYQYIIIGNFFDDANTDTTIVGAFSGVCGYCGYYYVDDICVSSDSLTCAVETGIEEKGVGAVRIYPNPTKGKIFIETNTNEEILVKIFNLFGELVSQTIIGNSRSIDLSLQPGGIYFISTRINETVKQQKIILIH